MPRSCLASVCLRARGPAGVRVVVGGDAVRGRSGSSLMRGDLGGSGIEHLFAVARLGCGLAMVRGAAVSDAAGASLQGHSRILACHDRDMRVGNLLSILVEGDLVGVA